jgi:DnaJ-class molecular chaperone
MPKDWDSKPSCGPRNDHPQDVNTADDGICQVCDGTGEVNKHLCRDCGGKGNLND